MHEETGATMAMAAEARDLQTHQTIWGSAEGRLQVACRQELMGQGCLSIQVA